MESEYEIIFTIVNGGYEEQVVASAERCGAAGGTLISARASAKNDSEKFFGISISPDKVIVCHIVHKDIRDTVLHSIYKTVGLSTRAQGMSFTLPIDEVSHNLKQQLEKDAALNARSINNLQNDNK